MSQIDLKSEHVQIVMNDHAARFLDWLRDDMEKDKPAYARPLIGVIDSPPTPAVIEAINSLAFAKILTTFRLDAIEPKAAKMMREASPTLHWEPHPPLGNFFFGFRMTPRYIEIDRKTSPFFMTGYLLDVDAEVTKRDVLKPSVNEYSFYPETLWTGPASMPPGDRGSAIVISDDKAYSAEDSAPKLFYRTWQDLALNND